MTNYSEEAPDRFLFGSVAYPIFNPSNPLGSDGGHTTGDPPAWFAPGCISLCYSVLSQEAADLCAAAEAYICTHSHDPGGDSLLFFNSQQQCAFTCPNGSVFVWTVAPGSFVSTSQALADQTAQSFACQQASTHFFCLGDLHIGACLGFEYNHSLNITGPNAGPFVVTIKDGALPAGFSIAQSGPGGKIVTINGTPSTTGAFTFTLRATDTNGSIITRSYTIQVLGITNAGTLPNFTVGTPYSEQLTTGGGTAPFTFGIVDGTLPAGLTLSSSGIISGTPTDGTSTLATVQVTDSTGIGCVADILMSSGTCPGPDWSTMVWDVAVADPGSGGGSATVNAVGAHVAATASGGPGPGGGDPSVTLHGSLTYTGDAATGKINISVFSNDQDPNPGNENGIRILQDGATVFLTDNNTQAGIFTFPLIAGVGSIIEVEGRFATMLLSAQNANPPFFIPASSGAVTFDLSNNC